MDFMRRAVFVSSLAGVIVFAALDNARAEIYTYDAGLGTLPTSQGWVKEQSGPASKNMVVDGIFKQQSVATDAVSSWSIAADVFDFTSSLATTLEARLRIDKSGYTSSGGAWRAGYAIAMSDTGDHHFILGISDTGVRLTNSLSWLDANSSAFASINTTSAFNTYTLVAQDNAVELFVNGASTLTLGVGASSNPGLRDQTFRFGDITLLAGSTADLEYVTANAVPEPSTLLLYVGMMGLGFVCWRREKRQ